MRKFRFSGLRLVSLLFFIGFFGASCSYYNRIMAKVNLVDGAEAYNGREFDKAIEKFRRAIEYDPEGNTIEGKTAKLFLARTSHSLFASNRRDSQRAKQAIEEYKKALPDFLREIKDNRVAADASPDDEEVLDKLKKHEKVVASIVSAVGSLHENLQQADMWRNWQLKTSENRELPNEVRANSLVALASKEYSCANEITDSKEAKKTIQKDGKPVYQYIKPKNEEDFDKLKKCVQEGEDFISKAIKFNGESDSAWSYKTSLLVQKMRVAEMDGKTEEKSLIEKEHDKSKAQFEQLVRKRREKEEAEAKKKMEKKKKGDEKKDGNEN